MVNATVSEDITRDTYLRAVRPGSSYGGHANIRCQVQASDTGHDNILLECTMPDNPFPYGNITIKQIKLRLKVWDVTGGGGLFVLHKLNHNEWTEGSGSGAETGDYEHDGGDGREFAEQAGSAPPPAAATLVTDGAEVGCFIMNDDDDCYGYIDTITETKATPATLTGGTDDDFDDGDGFRIWELASSQDASWLEYTTGVPWDVEGGDYDSDTDWLGIGGGIIAQDVITSTGWYEFDITKFIEAEGFTWGDVFPLILIATAANDFYYIDIRSRSYGTAADRPEIEVTFYDPPPWAPTISASWDIEAQKVKYKISGLTDQDFQTLKLFRDTSSGVDTGDTAVRVDYDALVDQTQIDNKKAVNIQENYTTLVEPIDGEIYYVRGFTEDNNNTGADATPSNELSFQRPRMKIMGDTDTFAIIDKEGNDGTGIDVMENVFVYALPVGGQTPLESIKKCYIEWGDGGKATYETTIEHPSGNPGALATTITVASTKYWEVGNYILMVQDIGGVKVNVRKIIKLTETVITVDDAFGNHAWTTDAFLTITRKHQYHTTGTKSAIAVLENYMGYRGHLRAVETAPDPQGIAPVAIIQPQKLNLLVSEEMNISGISSRSKNMDLALNWNTTIGGPYTHDGGNGEAFAKDTGEDFPTDGAVAGYLVYNITDKCHGIITTFTGTDQANMAGGLSGGTDDDFDNGDTFYVFACAWVRNNTTETPTLSDQDGAVSTISYPSAGSMSLKLHVADEDGNYDQETVAITVAAETNFMLQSGLTVVNANVANADTVTINGIEFEVDATPTGDQFEKGGSSADTATNLAAAINGSAIGDYFAIAQGDIVMIGGSLVATFATSDATAFVIQLRAISYEREHKAPEMIVDMVAKLGTTGHVRNLITLGSTVHNISGKAWTVDDKDALEDLNDGTKDYMLIIIDGSIRKAYPLSRGIVITEADYTPTDQTTGTTEGLWRWSGALVDGGAYS